MDSLLIHFQPEKKDFLLALLKELSFVGEIESVDEVVRSKFEEGVLESEVDISSHRLVSQKNMEKEILSWRVR